MSLSDRIRPNSEAAPWVIEEVKELERKLGIAKEALLKIRSENKKTESDFNDQKIYWRDQEFKSRMLAHDALEELK